MNTQGLRTERYSLEVQAIRDIALEAMQATGLRGLFGVFGMLIIAVLRPRTLLLTAILGLGTLLDVRIPHLVPSLRPATELPVGSVATDPQSGSPDSGEPAHEDSATTEK